MACARSGTLSRCRAFECRYIIRVFQPFTRSRCWLLDLVGIRVERPKPVVAGVASFVGESGDVVVKFQLGLVAPTPATSAIE